MNICTSGKGGKCVICGAPVNPKFPQNCPNPKSHNARLLASGKTPRGLGTCIAILLDRIGYTKDRHNWIRKLLGLTSPCKCRLRERQLNEWGWRQLNRIRALSNRFKRLLGLRV